MSFYSYKNSGSTHCPCSLNGNEVLSGLNEKICIQVQRVYDSCLNGCRYCYAGGGGQSALRRYERYDEYSPLLCSSLSPGDQVAKREAVSLVDDQLRFF